MTKKKWLFCLVLLGAAPTFVAGQSRVQKTGVILDGHHTKFPSALCTKFAQLIVLLLSQDFRGLFTLWTDAITTCAATLKNLPAFHQTRSSLGRPRCCQRTEDEPLHTEQYQHLFGQQLKSINFWALRSNQKIFQCPRPRHAQASSVANACRQKNLLAIVPHLKSVPPMRLLKSMNPK